jgi:hypothetical protein
MGDALGAAAVIGALFAGVVTVIRSFTSYKLKKKLIESGAVDPSSIKLIESEKDGMAKNSTLKWGLVFFFAGLGLVVIELFSSSLHHDSVLPFGIELVFVSAGFLIYVLLMKNKQTT